MTTATNELTITIPADEPSVTMERMFDAPRELVWKAMTDAKHVAQWWGLRDYKKVVTDWDFQVGGKWRIEQHGPDGSVYAFRGEYREITPIERFVNTFTMEGIYEDKTIVEAHILEDVNGKTKYSAISHYEAMEDRDGMVASGMEYGTRQSLDQLEELLKTL